MPKGALLLADRLYGCAAMVDQVQTRCTAVGSHSLVRVRKVRVAVGRPGRGAETLRLWTSLLEPQEAPALELAREYAQRWQHELYYREMKLELRTGELLQSHTPETAAQEVAALVVATALIAQTRRATPCRCCR